jgi:neutral trehalase
LDNAFFEKRENELREFIRNDLYCPEDGMFYDIWAIKDKSLRHQAFEGMWPVVVGAATQEQANRFIDDYLLNSKVFFTPHPIATVGVHDPKFELRMWRGPAWNSMTYWAARGCLNYGRKDAAIKLLERALDQTAGVYDRTGTVWEFYDPFGGDPEKLQRKPHTKFNVPCRDYLGHNPVIAMARMYDRLRAENGNNK